VDELLPVDQNSHDVNGVTNGAGDDYVSTCGGGSSNDYAYQWVPPFDGWFDVNTAGSGIDTVLAVYEGNCNATQVACNDDPLSGTSGRLVDFFEEGTSVVVVVDSKLGEEGAFELGIEAVTCPSQTITTDSFPITLNTSTGPSSHDGACGGGAHPERAIRWVPEESGMWRVRATSEDFLPAIYLQRGAACGIDEEIACNAKGNTFSPVPSEVVRFIEAGQPMTIIVDGVDGAGEVEIGVAKIGDTCDAGTPPGFFDDVAWSTLTVDQMTSTCGQNAFAIQSNVQPRPDVLYQQIGPNGPQFFCNLNLASDIEASMCILEGSCEGKEVWCGVTTFDSVNGDYRVGVDMLDILEPDAMYTVAISPTATPFDIEDTDVFQLRTSCS
jgi:hypothetical protein